MPLQATSGAASYDAFGGGVAVVPNYIEDVFSTWLYTGNSSTQTINNGIDLAGKGGAVWIKQRNGTGSHEIRDTVRGSNKALYPNSTIGEGTSSVLSAFTSSGFSLNGLSYNINEAGSTYASWTFREQPKFFDVVTYTGNGSTSGQTINHNLGSKPGTIIIKRTDAASDWIVQSRVNDTTYSYGLKLNSTAAQEGTYTPVDAQLNSTQFSNFIADNPLATNTNGATYVAYLFAHNAGGFGLTGTDNVISCGSFTGYGQSLNLGWEPQWLLIKSVNEAGDWFLADTMRGFSDTSDIISNARLLYPSLSNAEATQTFGCPTATGANLQGGGGTTFIYIAIRRGPMKTPTTGTSVFAPYSGDDSVSQNVGYPTDMYFDNNKAGDGGNTLTGSRLIGNTRTLSTASTAAETTIYGPSGSFASNTNFAPTMIGSGSVWYSFRRAPGFFDQVCYTGGSSDTQVYNHNLAVPPELIIIKRRNATSTIGWWVGANFSSTDLSQLRLNQTNAATTPTYSASSIFRALPTASTFTVGNYEDVGASGGTYVAYLFASAPGVSKVGSYTGTGTTQTINCGFTAGSRFVMIKRTDSTGDWYVWDSARGIVAGNDPYLLLNSTAAEVTNTDYIDTASTGFEISSTAPAAINANGGTFIFLAIA